MREFFGKFLLWLGQFIKSLALAVLTPDQLAELNRQAYLSPAAAESWSQVIDYGLSPAERWLLEKLVPSKGKLLLLGGGGGREAVVFARAGFEVTGVDFAPAITKAAVNNLREKGLRMEALVQDLQRLEVPPGSFDVVWISKGNTYSGIPTRRRRVEILKKARASLRPGGHVAYVFSLSRGQRGPRQKAEVLLRKTVAFLTRGNTGYQAGDHLVIGRMFDHRFQSEEEVRSEFEEGGFEVLHLSAPSSAGSLLGRVRANGLS